MKKWPKLNNSCWQKIKLSFRRRASISFMQFAEDNGQNKRVPSITHP
jgi:hypothetical protein